MNTQCESLVESFATGVLETLKIQNPNIEKEELKELFRQTLKILKFNSEYWVKFFFE